LRVGQLRKLVGGVLGGASRLLDGGVERLLLLSCLLSRAFVHLAATGDQIHEDPEERDDGDKERPQCL
jgi:hypothetical protein